MEIFKEDLNEFQVLEEIPKNLLDEIVERTSNYFDNFISSRMEMKTLANMKTSPEKRTKKRKLNQNIPDEIASIYQRAHESYLDDDFDLAIKLATEAKNILPSAPEPYSLLASISEELGSLEESLIYLEKAVRLSSDSSEIWIEYSKLSKDLGRISDSATCLKRAIRSNPENINSLLELQELLEGEIEDPRKKLFCLTELNKRRPDNPEYARQLALYLHETGRIEDSLQVLQKHLDYQLNNQIEIDINNVNLLSRGYLNENQNGLVIKIDQIITEAPPDFRVNAACAYIRMKEIDKAKEKFELIYELSPLEFSDAYSIIVDELIKSSYFKEAINLLNRIQENGLESRKDLAFCYEMLQKPKKAVKILQDILLSDPLDSSVCSHFFFLMSHLGHETEIYDFVHKNCPECIQNEEMLFQISTNYLNSGNIDKYLSSSTVFFCRILYDLSLNQIQKHTPSAIKEILGLTNSEKITPLLLKVLKYKRFSKNLTIPEEEFRKLCSTSIHLYHDKHCAVETLVMSGLFCLLYPKKFDEYNTLFIFTLTSFKSGYSIEACTLMRSIILKNTDNYLVWKYFNHFIQSTPNEENSAYKFLTRAAVKLPFNPAIQIILGNHSQSTVWFDHAITQYISAMNSNPDDPLISLLLASSYISKAYVRTQKNTRKAVLCSFSCIMKYFELRNIEFPIESYYNMGRYYQAIGMLPQAEIYYRKVLDSETDYIRISNTPVEHDLRYSLKRDAAFNLLLIYRNSNPHEARRLINKYLTIEDEFDKNVIY